MAGATFTPLSGSVGPWTDGTALDYTTAGTYLTTFKPGGATADIREVFSPGEDSGGTQNFGIRPFNIQLEVTYVAATEAAAVLAFDNDAVVLAGGVFSVVAAGVTYAACKLVGEPEADQARATGLVSALTYMVARFVFRCVRPV